MGDILGWRRMKGIIGILVLASLVLPASAIAGGSRGNIGHGSVPVSHDRSSRYEQAYSAHTQKLTLNNSRHVTTNQYGEYEYRPIFTNVLVVHRNIVLSMDRESMYIDDGLDENGDAYYLYFVFSRDGVSSRVTLAENLRPAPLEVLSEVQREILRASITDLAKSGCGVVIPGSVPLDRLSKFDLYPCVQQVFARSRG